MEPIIDFINVLGLLGTISSIVWVCFVIYWTVRGLAPVLYRLGYGLSRRKIAIVAEGDDYHNLKQLLDQSKLFKSKNITPVLGSGQLENLDKIDVVLINWPSCTEYFLNVINAIPARASIIVHAPPSGGRISDNFMEQLELRRNVVVNNFRGRLMNDIVTSMITSAYDKR